MKLNEPIIMNIGIRMASLIATAQEETSGKSLKKLIFKIKPNGWFGSSISERSLPSPCENIKTAKTNLRVISESTLSLEFEIPFRKLDINIF